MLEISRSRRVGAEFPEIRRAVEGAGYAVAEPETRRTTGADRAASRSQEFARQVLMLLGVVFGTVLFVVVVGEYLGVFERLTERVPWLVGLAIVLAGGYPVFRGVLRVALRRQVTSHTLMTLGVVAALAVGQWATALGHSWSGAHALKRRTFSASRSARQGSCGHYMMRAGFPGQRHWYAGPMPSRPWTWDD